MDDKLLSKLLDRTPTMEKVGLLRDVFDLSPEVTIEPKSSSEFNFSFYGKSLAFNIETILKHADKFKAYLDNKIEKAKNSYEEENSIIEALSQEKEFDVQEFYEDKVPSARTEEDLAEIFEGNIDELRRFYNSPSRSNLDQLQRGFLHQVLQDPFLPLWDNPDSE